MHWKGLIQIKTKTRLIISSCFFATVTLVCALLIKDNDDLVFQLLMWLPSLFLLGVGSAVGFAASFLACRGAYTIYGAVQKFFNPDRIIASNTKKHFRKWASIAFTLFALVVLSKFVSDFVFAQIVGSYIFLSLALGFFNGAILALLAELYPRRKAKTIWIDKEK